MENAVDALKIAFAVMVFTIALTLAISTFSLARETSEAVLYMNDKTNYYEYEIAEEHTDENGNIYYETSDGIKYTSERIVGIETIIPTLYRYYKENYTVIFEGINIYNIDSSTKKWTMSTGEGINYFDLNSEIKSNCPWVGTVNYIKKNLDLFLKGTSIPGMTLKDKSFGNPERFVTYNGFINEYKDNKFLEQLGEYSTDRTYGINVDGNLEIINKDGEKTILKQVGTLWTLEGSTKNNLKDADDNTIPLPNTLENIATAIGTSSSTFLDQESGEVIELAKPTIKRVIKYTLQTP